jgi:hypothetical protein
MALCFVAAFYLLAALFNLYVPDTGVDHRVLHKNPWYLLREFNHCLMLLWRDRLGQVSLAVTTLFWGAGATLQFIVIKWAETALQLDLSKSSMLQGVVAVGVALGAVGAARMITLRKSVRVIPLGIAMGVIVLVMNFVEHIWLAVPLLVLIGALSGFFVVPMNALLQHRGHILMGAGHSIAVQNFNENLSILAMTGLYFLMIRSDVSIYLVITLFGMFVSGAMWLVKGRHEANQERHPGRREPTRRQRALSAAEHIRLPCSFFAEHTYTAHTSCMDQANHVKNHHRPLRSCTARRTAAEGQRDQRDARRADPPVGVANQSPHPAARRGRGHCRLCRPARPLSAGPGGYRFCPGDSGTARGHRQRNLRSRCRGDAGSNRLLLGERRLRLHAAHRRSRSGHVFRTDAEAACCTCPALPVSRPALPCRR